MPDIKLEDGRILVTVGDNPLADAIGALFINFAVFNSSLNSALTAMLGLSLPQARALVVPLQARPKIEMISQFAKRHWPKETADEIKKLCKQALELADHRNEIAHGDMVRESETSPVMLALYNGPRRFEPLLKPLEAEAVAHAAMHALHLGQEFREFARTVVAHRSKQQGDE